jgi:hypothetical protein
MLVLRDIVGVTGSIPVAPTITRPSAGSCRLNCYPAAANLISGHRSRRGARMSDASTKPVIFISYAHADEPEKPAEGEVKWLSFVCRYLQPAVKGAFSNSGSIVR